jgi:hypothetical protein
VCALTKQAASQVQFLVARVRMVANLLSFLPAVPENAAQHRQLNTDLEQLLAELSSEYSAMLYGGTLLNAVRVWRLRCGRCLGVRPAHGLRAVRLALTTAVCADAGPLTSIRCPLALLATLHHTQLPGEEPIVTTAALFRDARTAHLYFKTTDCLRFDKSGCFNPGVIV